MSKFTIRSPIYHCSIEEAFDYVSNVDNRPQWQRPLDKVSRKTSAPDREGTYWQESFRILGMKHTAYMSYTKFERPTLFVEDADLPLCTGIIDMIFEKHPDGCQLVVTSKVSWKGIYKILTPLLVYNFKKMVKQDLLDIKHFLENRSDH